MQISDTPEGDPLLRRWVCLCCGTKTPFGHMKVGLALLHCPVCNSMAIEPADGAVITVDSSYWMVPSVWH